MNGAALRVQNGAYRTLNANLEQEIAAHRAKAREYDAAIKTLDSEREANAILTATIEAQASALRAIAEGNLGDLPWQANYAKVKQVARNALPPPLPDTGLQAINPSA